MSFFSSLYTLIIGPLELFFEVIYAFACQLTTNAGVSIIFLSLAINFLVLPLYRQADEMQAQEAAMEKKLKPWVTHIKKTFKGDERFMMLQTLYRQNNYKPTHVLKGSVTLILEIPFFLAAYNFLSGLQLLHGISFGPIRDLGAPDAMIVLGGFSVNVLPILMTAINLVSSAIYTKNASTRSKVQLYVMAGLFLVLLYDSPAGLVFYWTLNNLFSLVKNIICGHKGSHPVGAFLKKYLTVIISVIALAAGLIILLGRAIPSLALRISIAAMIQILHLPLVLQILLRKGKLRPFHETSRKDKGLFWCGCLLVTFVTGLMIPTSVIGASPAEFLNMATQNTPLTHVLHALLLAAGTFLLWFGIFYMLAGSKGKKYMGLAVWLMALLGVMNFVFFGNGYGNMSASLHYDVAPLMNTQEMLVNIAAILAMFAVGFLLWKKRADFVKIICVAGCLAVIAMSGMNIYKIQTVSKSTVDELNAVAEETPNFTLSKNGKNVMVLMMDRAVSSYVPYMFRERPELQQQFAGFTYYPNTISFGGSTNFGSPALYGGYEYTPAEMNRREDQKLVEKHNEALRVMPAIFDGADFEVTVCDPSYAGYQWIPDLSIYDDYPDIRTFLTLGKFSAEETDAYAEEMLDRNLFCYSLFRISPVFIQPALYAGGTYNSMGPTSGQIVSNIHQANGTAPVFEAAYAVLDNLETMTKITDTPENTFLMMSNDTTHSPALLSEPEYLPAVRVDNREYDESHKDRFLLDGVELKMEEEIQVMHYQVNMASMLRLGQWFDYLRSQGVYDNTRIIIVADHGYALHQLDHMMLEKEDLMRFNPLLMVKDFGAREFTTDESFMTNADAPTLAFQGLVDAPVNPATGKPVNNEAKQGQQYIIRSFEWDTSVNDGNAFMDSKWLSVHDNIFDLNNWEMYKDSPAA